MKLRQNQEQAYYNIEKYGKAFICWQRNTGKSYLLSYIIRNFVANNKSNDILFFVNQKNQISISQDHLIQNISREGIIRKHKKGEIALINNNYLTFCCIKDYDHFLHHLTPSLIVYDEFSFSNTKNFDFLIKYLKTSNCKCIFITPNIDLRFINILDSNNDYYINIKLGELIDPKIIEKLSYKPEHLLDTDELIYQRKKKLRQLKSLSEDES